MKTKYIFEILQEIAKTKKKEDKIKILKPMRVKALKDVIRGSMDKSLKWIIPDGDPPYTPSEHITIPQIYEDRIVSLSISFKVWKSNTSI